MRRVQGALCRPGSFAIQPLIGPLRHPRSGMRRFPAARTHALLWPPLIVCFRPRPPLRSRTAAGPETGPLLRERAQAEVRAQVQVHQIEVGLGPQEAEMGLLEATAAALGTTVQVKPRMNRTAVGAPVLGARPSVAMATC